MNSLLFITALSLTFLSASDEQDTQTAEESSDELSTESVSTEPASGAGDFETVVRTQKQAPTDKSAAFGETILLGESAASASSISAVLSESTGVQVRQVGGLGSFGVASIRGSTPGQVPIYLDGVLLNAAGFSSVNLGDLPLDNLDRLEIYRGHAPGALGTSGMGGAIHLHTHKARKRQDMISATFGSWGTRKLVALHSGPVGEENLLATLNLSTSDGDFWYLNRNGTLNNYDDDEIVRRSNNAHIAGGGLLKLSGKLGGFRYSISNDFFRKEQGVAGIDSVPTQNAHLKTLRNSTALRLTYSGLDKKKLQLSLDYLVLNENFDDSSLAHGELGLGRQIFKTRSDAFHAGFLLDWLPIKKHKLSARLDARREVLTQEDELLADSETEVGRIR
ncbi:TonB-dependent receptor plug domain-containing protein, partial [Myxococcota bacterium]|nr:TonB-dependent receptor plug domain-containing protein [Myxococcota bacterium]